MSLNLEAYYGEIINHIREHKQISRSDLDAFIVKTLEVKEPYRVIRNLKKHGIIVENKIISLKEVNNDN